MKAPIYIVTVIDNGFICDYEYSNIVHATEHMNDEISKGNQATITECTNY
jgi:hypothetical protein